MGLSILELPWCTITVDTGRYCIFLQERWKYEWLLTGTLAAWTDAEKKSFHDRADRAIWAAWSFKVKFQVRGTSAFARACAGKLLPINFDIRWVLANQHWDVKVYKVARNAFRTSSVNWTNRVIQLDTNDFETSEFENGAAPNTKQIPVAHEFGHTIGNSRTVHRNRGDEYRRGHVNVNDHASILNHGSQLRVRHFQTIIDEMNQMMPDTIFSVGAVAA